MIDTFNQDRHIYQSFPEPPARKRNYLWLQHNKDTSLFIQVNFTANGALKDELCMRQAVLKGNILEIIF